MLKIGDKVRMISKSNYPLAQSAVYKRSKNGIGYITGIDHDDGFVVNDSREKKGGDYFQEKDLVLVEGVDMKVRFEDYPIGTRFKVIDRGSCLYVKKGAIIEKTSTDGYRDINNGDNCGGCFSVSGTLELINEDKGEEKMTNEEVKRPEYVIIVKNTEVFKKGGVFKYYSSFYSPVVTEDAYTVKPYGDEYIRHEQVDLLLEKKIAVEAVQFNPAFVTLEQNEVLGKALDGMKTKKAPAKSAKKTVSKVKKTK